jgi:hypothetical protein
VIIQVRYFSTVNAFCCNSVKNIFNKRNMYNFKFDTTFKKYIAGYNYTVDF